MTSSCPIKHRMAETEHFASQPIVYEFTHLSIMFNDMIYFGAKKLTSGYV